MILRPFAATALLLAGCAGIAREGVTPFPSDAARWSANLQLTQTRGAGLSDGSALSTRQRATGTAEITELGSGRVRVALTVSAPQHTNSQLSWAVLTGVCGSSAIPVMNFHQFPLLEVNANGRGQVSADLPFQLHTGESYHINVYRGRGQQAENVLSCGALRPED